MKQKIQGKFFVFEIIPSEFVALNWVYQERIPSIGTQCVRKRILDVAYP